MKTIITDEWIQYKSGFISGKKAIVEAFKLGKILNLNEESTEEIQATWYAFGFQDGFAYFSKLIDDNMLDLANINTKEIIVEAFKKRVIEYNQEKQEEISIGKFRM